MYKFRQRLRLKTIQRFWFKTWLKKSHKFVKKTIKSRTLVKYRSYQELKKSTIVNWRTYKRKIVVMTV